MGLGVVVRTKLKVKVNTMLIRSSVGRSCTLYRRLRPHRPNDRPTNRAYRTLFIRTFIQCLAIYRFHPDFDQ